MMTFSRGTTLRLFRALFPRFTPTVSVAIVAAAICCFSPGAEILAQEPEAEIEAELEPEAETQTETTPEPEAQIEPEAAPEPEPEPEVAPEPEAATETEAVPESEAAPEPEPEGEIPAPFEAAEEAAADAEVESELETLRKQLAERDAQLLDLRHQVELRNEIARREAEAAAAAAEAARVPEPEADPEPEPENAVRDSIELSPVPSSQEVTHSELTPHSYETQPEGCTSDYCCADEGWWDNLSLFIGLEGSKQPQDFGVNAHFGGRTSANWGAPIFEEYGLGMQIGTALNATDNAVQVFDRVEGTSGRVQSFSTLGIFQRTECGFNYGVVYDFLYQEYYDEYSLGQWRGRAGYEITDCDEVGVWGTLSDRRDTGTFGPIPVTLDPISQANVYWWHIWPTKARTGLWLGVCEGHAETNLALGDLAPATERMVFGSDVNIPLSNYISLFGEANFLMPSDTGTVDAYLGFAYYPGGGAFRSNTNRFAPLLPVANSTSFSVDLDR